MPMWILLGLWRAVSRGQLLSRRARPSSKGKCLPSSLCKLRQPAPITAAMEIKLASIAMSRKSTALRPGSVSCKKPPSFSMSRSWHAWKTKSAFARCCCKHVWCRPELPSINACVQLQARSTPETLWCLTLGARTVGDRTWSHARSFQLRLRTRGCFCQR